MYLRGTKFHNLLNNLPKLSQITEKIFKGVASKSWREIIPLITLSEFQICLTGLYIYTRKS